MPDLKYLRSVRGHQRTQVTKKCNEIEDNYESFSPCQIKEHTLSLKSLKQKLEDYNSIISELVWKSDEESLSAELMSCDEYDAKITHAMSLLESVDQNMDFNNVSSKLKLPDLPLPEYSHSKGESIEKFFRDFEDVTRRANLNSYTKLLYLQRQTKKEPHTLIQSLSSGSRTYEDAKSLLMEAFGSKIMQKYDSIKMLAELQLSYNDDPYKVIGEMKMIRDSFTNLSVSVDDIVQYFYWNSMNDCLKSQLIQITGKSKPSLQEMDKHIFEATERYVEAQEKFKEKKRKKADASAINLAASIKPTGKHLSPSTNNFRSCILCSKDNKVSDHPIYKCPNFTNPDSKIDKLKSLNACAKCANLHKTEACKFRFKSKCKYCNKWHFSFLCLHKDTHSPKPEKSSSRASNNEAHIGVTHFDFEVMHIEHSSSSILPTFTTSVPDGSMIRCLKDTGSQMTFIDRELAEQQGLEVVNPNFNLVVSGFNESRSLNTKIVKLEMISDAECHIIEAVCVPKIKTKLYLPGLGKIVKGFSRKGYVLADQYLTAEDDEISNIKLLLGTDYDFTIPVSTKLFGKPISSVYLESSFGIMLCGQVDRILENLRHLPNLNPPFASCHTLTRIEHSDIMLPPEELVENCNLGINYPKVAVVNEKGKVVEASLLKALDDVLLQESHKILNYDDTHYNDNSIDSHNMLIDFALDSTTRNEEGRLIMPLLWNREVSHLLGNNQHLSKIILNSNLKKYSKNEQYLNMIDEVLKEQENLGIIKKIEDLPRFLEENPNFSFLPHMPVFRMEKESTKCRVVYLSNLSEKDPQKPMTVSHNQAMLAGPCLNRKISTAVLQLRFDKKVLCFDLKKAFLQIELPESDQVKLLFYWFKNVAKRDFSLVAYKHVRLPFGLKPSPAILLLGLYKILILDTKDDSPKIVDLKRRIYDLCYMDNCAYSTNDSVTLNWAFAELKNIFEPYKFTLQQFVTNDKILQEKIDESENASTPSKVKLFGLLWDIGEDTISTQKLNLNKMASSKREILRSIASNYDIFNFNIPLLNRARLFMQQLQEMKELDWDIKLPAEKLKEWKNIAAQVNSSPEISVNRYVGKREDSYKLVAFTDSSRMIYATVIYIVNETTKEVSFLLSKNRLINKQLSTKSIPSLEFQAISFGTEVLIDTFKELTGPMCVQPINIVSLELYTDSLVCLNWLHSHVNKIDKLKNLNTFVTNRLNSICKLCEEFPIAFSFCEGTLNPSDSASRPISYKRLMKTNFLTGPAFLSDDCYESSDTFRVVIPNPLVSQSKMSTNNDKAEQLCVATAKHESESSDYLFPMDLFSKFHRLLSVQHGVLRFINNCKIKLRDKDPVKYSHFICLGEEEIFAKAHSILILQDQKAHFPEVFGYFTSRKPRKDMPNIVGQLNIFPDKNGLLRVKSKCARWKDMNEFNFIPILLPKSSLLTKAIILDMHRRTSHAGVYTLLSELRKQFYIPHYFSTVKKILKECVNCRRFNRKPIKLNQSPYRSFRLEPPNIPYRYVFMDHLGPYWITWNSKKVKVWLLCITCLWSRAINLKLCLDLSMPTFLRAFQMHIHEFGMPEKCFSDKGTQIVSGANVIKDFLNDPGTKQYLQENNIKALEFQQYYKGCNQLGSLVESCVKLVKRLIYGSIKNSVLNFLDFEFLISEVVHLVNRRPVAFKDALRDCNVNEDIPAPITPEILLKGYELVSLNVIPSLQPVPIDDPSWIPDSVDQIKDNYSKLRKARLKLIEIYNSEFLAQLINQATDDKSRYKPVSHNKLQVGDIVLIKEPLQKPANYPMGKVMKVQVNDLQEVTGATIMKGNRSRVEMHVDCLIPLLSVKEYESVAASKNIKPEANLPTPNPPVNKPKRKAAAVANEKNSSLARDNLI